VTQRPTVELIRYPLDDLKACLPGVDLSRVEALASEGVPLTLLGRYVAVERLSTIEDPKRGPLVWFGVEGLSMRICADPTSGEVVAILDVPDAVPHLVSSSLALFSQTIQAVAARVPFYGPDPTVEEMDGAAEDVARIVRAIDPPGMASEGFWSTLVDDVLMGDFMTAEPSEPASP
jgi:hypothetical protein